MREREIEEGRGDKSRGKSHRVPNPPGLIGRSCGHGIPGSVAWWTIFCLVLGGAARVQWLVYRHRGLGGHAHPARAWNHHILVGQLARGLSLAGLFASNG